MEISLSISSEQISLSDFAEGKTLCFYSLKIKTIAILHSHYHDHWVKCSPHISPGTDVLSP